MARARGAVLVRDRTALEQLRRAQELKEQAAKVEGEVMHLLGPLKDHLRELVLERDRLLYDAIAARQNFFTAAKKAYPQLAERRGLRCETRRGKVHIRWDDTGPHYSAGESVELPQLHAFMPRQPGRRPWDLLFWLD